MRIETSSIEIGSSARITLGSTASARAIATRWRCPPESWCGYFCAISSGGTRPTRASSSRTRPSTAPRGQMRWICSGRAMWWSMRLTGIERRERILEDHLHVRAVVEQRPAPPLVADVVAVEHDRAVGGRVEAREQPRDGALAAAALAHERGHAAGAQRERHVGDGVAASRACRPAPRTREALAEAAAPRACSWPRPPSDRRPGGRARSRAAPGARAVCRRYRLLSTPVHCGQRGWKRQPDGGLARSGGAARDARERHDRARERRERAHQPVRVRVQRVPEEHVGGRGLDDLARVHDRDAVAELDEQREVVRDEQHREAEALA